MTHYDHSGSPLSHSGSSGEREDALCGKVIAINTPSVVSTITGREIETAIKLFTSNCLEIASGLFIEQLLLFFEDINKYKGVYHKDSLFV